MRQLRVTNQIIADIGGTHTRFAFTSPGEGLKHIETFNNQDYSDLASIIERYISDLGPTESPRTAAFAVASPIAGDLIKLTNLDWEFSLAEYTSRFELDKLHVINDFAAIALAVPELKENDLIQIGTGKALAGNPVGVIGPGTGLGVAVLIPVGSDWIPVDCEGGHVTLAAVTEREAGLIKLIREEYGHVSAERILSGPGLSTLYQALAKLEGKTVEQLDAPTIINRVRRREDLIAVDTADTFFAMLGTVAGNLALTLGAKGGIYLAGGILPRMSDMLQASSFRERFINKGRYRSYLEQMPTWLITTEVPAFIGLQAYLKHHSQ
jgi:glucokinase